MQRGKTIGLGTPSVAPDQAKGGLPLNPQRVETPPRSRSAERGEGVSGREDTPPRSRSTERSDGRDGGTPPVLQPTPRVPSSIGWLSRPRSLERDTPREPSATSEGLGPIIIGASGGNAPDPTPPSGMRASSLNPIRRAISALTGRGRDPQPPPPRRGREPTRDGQTPPDVGGGHSDTSSYQSDTQRSDESPEGYRPPPSVPITTNIATGRRRPNIPTPPQFHDTLYVGALIRPPQDTHLCSDGDDTDRASTPREINQPQGEPEPEMPGGTEPSDSEPTSRQTETDNQDEEGDSPDHTDTDPYGDPTESQADVEQEPDTEGVVLIDSPDEAPVGGGAMINTEPPSTAQETPPTIEAVPDVSQETPPATITEVASGAAQETAPTAEVVPSAVQETPQQRLQRLL